MARYLAAAMRRSTLLPALTLSLGLCACNASFSAGGSPHSHDGEPALLINRLGMQMQRIPAGEFMMGSAESPSVLAQAFPGYEPERFTQLQDEAPVHRVRISHAFYLGQHEVTVGQFRRFLAASGYVPQSVADGTGGFGYSADHVTRRQPNQDAFAGRDPKYSWQNPGFTQSDD